MFITLKFFLINNSIKLLPIKPSPPVTTTFIIIILIYILHFNKQAIQIFFLFKIWLRFFDKNLF